MDSSEKVKVLIVDDEEEARLLLKKNLERQGYCVMTAMDGEDGLEKVKEHDIEIIFCDIVMPGLNGIDFLKEVRHHNLAAQVVMVTGKASLDNCVEAIEYGACGYLIKPIEIKDLLDLILVAERNIAEEKEILKKVIKGLSPGEIKAVLRHVSKPGKDVDKKRNIIKKTLKKPDDKI
jgi:two-component system NtrC family response regulator